MPIAIAPINTSLKIIKILVDDKTKRHLENLGIFVNACVLVVAKNDGSIILKVKDGRLAINKETALKIFVG
ncbi:MAG: ferrous iron transport protein A [Bacilli bacterium]|nr:ferrous iron transport protein A [Bacilli bacterium]